MRFSTILIAAVAGLATATPINELEDRAPVNVLCSCAATQSCGCNGVVAGSWCVCNGDNSGTWNAAPCQDSTSCGCSGLGKWGVCEVSDDTMEGVFDNESTRLTMIPETLSITEQTNKDFGTID
ncbi:hypothetical protein CTRI78_v010680 [Colletotrichum trifolii]|uniref:Uncharacterized protein n=1 Tax=Colletotrichum trifolii TaxID=5466 RepID=A0A4R8QJB2_COLTR|nr:hypothetical protein CTRI78_v010680 [Colletotrichum trifolii]